MPTLIQEQSAKLVERAGSRWLVNVITPGPGSSGFYAEDILARDAAAAFPAGTKMWFKHPSFDEGPGDRDPRDQWGVMEEDARWDESRGAVVSTVRVLDHWASIVNSLGEQADLSIYAWAEADDQGNITALLPHRTNSVDIVSYPGRPGSGLQQQIEAAREAAPKPTVEASAEEKEDAAMDEKDIAAIAGAVSTAIAETFKPVLDFVNESTAKAGAEAQAKVDAEALDAATEKARNEFAAAVEKIDAADLLEPIAESLKAKAKSGAEISESEITEAVKQSKALVEAAEARAGVARGGYGTVHESNGGTTVSASESVKEAW